jgi:hypothetical protein
MNKAVKKKLNFINSSEIQSENDGLSPSFIALSFDGFGSISRHGICLFVCFFFRLFHSFHIFFHIPNFSGLSRSVKMRIWCIKIGIVLALHFNPRVEPSAGGLLDPEGLYSPVAKYFGTCLKIRI